MDEKNAIEKLKVGDYKAFDFLFTSFSDKLFRFFLHHLKNRETAKEFTQDVFLKIWAHRADIKAIHSFESYMFALGRNHMIDYLRRKVNERRILDELYLDAERSQQITPDLHQQYTHRETLHQYRSLLGKLDLREREIFVLNREKGWSYRQIALKLNISVRAVEWNISKTLRFLKQHQNDLLSLLLLLLTQR